MELCEVCRVECHKYKCPTCRFKYCSVKCCKIHRESSCKGQILNLHEELEEGEILETESQITKDERNQSWNLEMDAEDMSEDRVPVEKLEALGRDEQLIAHLRNPHLRVLLSGLDAEMQAGRAAQTIQAAMMEPIFLEFVDRCLHVVEPKEEE